MESLIVRIEDALKLHEEPSWRKIETWVMSQLQNKAGEWYERDPNRLVQEVRILQEWLDRIPKYPCYFYKEKGKKILGAMGLATLKPGRTKILLDFVYPSDYPKNPPKVFLAGPGVKRKLGDKLGKDGALPIPGMNQQWDPDVKSDVIIRCAIIWLNENTRIRVTNDY